MERFITAINEAILNKNWFSWLFLALCMPDICGSLETPGKLVWERYKEWFNKYLSHKYGTMFSAEDCYYFRCSCLHEGLDSHNKLTHERIHFIVPPPHGNIVHLNTLNDVLQMQIDLFCTDISDAVNNWNNLIAKDNSDIQQKIDKLIQIHQVESISQFISFE